FPLLAAAQQSNPSGQPATNDARDYNNSSGQTQVVQGDQNGNPNNAGAKNLGENASSAVVPGGGAGSFFIALLAGLVLAMAFQLLLTNLSVAAGLNMFGPIDRSKPRKEDAGPEDSAGDTVKKISTTFGIWTLVTASIALFFGSWLGGTLGLTANRFVGGVLGLAIWGLFYLLMMMLEATAFTSLVGALGRMAASAFKAGASAIGSVFAKSEASKAADTAAEITKSVRDELFGDMDMDDVKDTIGKYLKTLAPPKIDVAEIRRELAKLLDDTEIQAIAAEGPGLDRDTMIAHLRNRGIEESRASQLAHGVQQAISTFKEERGKPKDKVSKVADTALRMTGMSSGEAEEARTKFEDYLRNTHKEELNPEGIKRDLEKLFTNRKEGLQALKTRVGAIDRDTVVAVLAQRDDMTEEEARHIVDQVQSVLQQAGAAVSSAKEGVTNKIRNYLNSLDRPELNYEGVSDDFQKLFHNPKEGADALLRRLKMMDRETLKAIIASTRDDMTEEDAERLLNKIESARDAVIQKAEQMVSEVQRRVELAKEEVLHQAEETRKVAAGAAWWAFAASVISGIAAFLGGVLGATTFWH
ncbi:MAG TPA: hypothetical protein VF889_05280, partial [Bacteroidota bacterium]